MDQHLAVVRWRMAALLAAIVGAGASAYLLVEYLTGQSGFCLTGSGCDLVRSSAYAYPLGIPMPLFGLAFYLGAAWLVASTLDGRRIAGVSGMRVLLTLALAGALASLVLTGIEAFVLAAWCSWCVLQAAASLVLLSASIGMARGHARPAERDTSARRRHRAIRLVDGERAALRRTGFLGGGAMALAVGLLLTIGAIGSGAASPADGTGLAPADSPRIGHGPVTIVEFADFQCPGCAALAPVVAQMAANDEFTLVYRYFPLLSIHANADASARAAAAADRQGAFWAMSERIYATQTTWQDLPPGPADAHFEAMAGAIGLDTAQWRADYASAEVAIAVANDLAAATDLGLSGTPTLFVGGQRYRGSLSAEAIRAAVAAPSPPA